MLCKIHVGFKVVRCPLRSLLIAKLSKKVICTKLAYVPFGIACYF